MSYPATAKPAGPSVTDRVKEYATKEVEDIKAYFSGGEMGSPVYGMILAIVAALLFVMVIFYLQYVYFDPVTGSIGKKVTSVFVSSHGLLFYFFAVLMIGGAAAAFALSYVKNEMTIMYTLVSAAVMSLIFFLGLKNLTDQASSASYWIWVAIGAIVPFVLSVYGIYSLWKASQLANKTAEATGRAEDVKLAELFKTRFYYSIASGVISLIGIGGVVAGFVIMLPGLTP